MLALLTAYADFGLSKQPGTTHLDDHKSRDPMGHPNQHIRCASELNGSAARVFPDSLPPCVGAELGEPPPQLHRLLETVPLGG